VRNQLREIYRIGLSIGAKIFGVKATKQFDARFRFKKQLDLASPKTLSDKICWLELNETNPITSLCSDKYAVREYVKNKGLGDLLVPLYGGVYTAPEEIDFQSLPQQFVLKATHGCEMNIICEDKDSLDWEKAKKRMNHWLHTPQWRMCLEPHYLSIQPRIICEKYLGNSNSIIDYKFHCLNGVPQFILACFDRDKGLKLNLYDLKWNQLDEICDAHRSEIKIPPPAGLKEMIEVSRKLAQDFKFVRVDLYEIDGVIFFGELTFTPATGVLPYFSDKLLLEYGRKLAL
jgi:hypothetical protein